MKHLKLFEEININGSDFPSYGHELSQRESKILKDLVADYLDRFVIKVDDHSYYVIHNRGYYNMFETFQELKDYLLLRYYKEIGNNEELIKLLKTSKIDPSFDDNIIIRWSYDRVRFSIDTELNKEIVIYLLNDERVRSKLTNEDISKIIKYTNEKS